MQLTKEIIQKAVMSVPKRSRVRPGYIPSAVLMLFFDRNHETNVVYIRRTHGTTLHSGQMAFPGGKIERDDESSYAAAVRETLEEIGVEKKEYDYLGEMGYFETITSKFDAAAHVAWSPTIPTYVRSEFEVAEIIEIPLSALLPQFRSDLDWANEHEVMYLNFNYVPPGSVEVNLWGLTARITHHFLDGLTRQL